jgi:DNA recombination protein RmuC
MSELLSILVLATSASALVFAFMAWRSAARVSPLGRDDAAILMRGECDAVRRSGEEQMRGLRQEISGALAQSLNTTVTTVTAIAADIRGQVDAFGERLAASNRITEDKIAAIGLKLNTDIAQMGESAATNRDALRSVIEEKLASSAAAHSDAARALREELDGSFQRMRQNVGDVLVQSGGQQKERLDETKRALEVLTEKHAQTGEQMRKTVEGRLDLLRTENAAELEKVRITVDEKLQTTLEKRLGESFGRVVEQLNKAYEVFGEMRTISANVGDLKNVLTNPKLRGTFGEVQLEMLLQDFLSPGQYIKDAQVKEGSNERVEFAIRLPMAEGGEMLLPVDAKFPREDHEHMIAAMEIGDMPQVEHYRKQLENRIKTCAKDISRKYINPPRTTERAILFLPTESLFAEVLRQPGLFDFVLRECNVMLAGPTTFACNLHAFQVNHRSMAIARRSGEVWNILSAVRTEFKKYNETVGKVARQLKAAAGSVDELDKRTRMMDRALKGVETMPDDNQSAKLLGLVKSISGDEPASEDEARPLPITFPASRQGDETSTAALRFELVEQ